MIIEHSYNILNELEALNKNCNLLFKDVVIKRTYVNKYLLSNKIFALRFELDNGRWITFMLNNQQHEEGFESLSYVDRIEGTTPLYGPVKQVYLFPETKERDYSLNNLLNTEKSGAWIRHYEFKILLQSGLCTIYYCNMSNGKYHAKLDIYDHDEFKTYTGRDILLC